MEWRKAVRFLGSTGQDNRVSSFRSSRKGNNDHEDDSEIIRAATPTSAPGDTAVSKGGATSSVSEDQDAINQCLRGKAAQQS